MADRKWSSATGDLNATASWGGTIPTGSESWFFPATNSQSVTSNKTALTALTPTLFYVDENYGGAIGTNGGPVECSPATLKMFGGQELHFKDGGGTTALVVIACKSAGTIVTLDGTSMTKIIVLRGDVTIKSSAAAITDLEVGWVNNRQGDANVTIEAGAGTITNMRLSGGQVTSDGPVTNLIVDGGTITQDTATITTADIYSGFFNFNFAGTIATLNLRGGLTDFTRNDLAKTVTNMNRFPGSEFEFIDDLTTFTNTVLDMRKRK